MLLKPYRLLFLSLVLLVSKGRGQAYFQQLVNYTINVTLDDQRHMLNGGETIEYTNNSPTALSFLYFHLWPNAYSEPRTHLGRQMLSKGKLDFYYASKEKRGFMDSLDFKVNGLHCNYQTLPDTVDVCKILLQKPVQPGETVIITTPFRVKIPDASFSRLGHLGQAYYITQWYPKPAVFDPQGWHQMPYLDQGEFYSEFGSFDVSITLPENYVVAATGDRQPGEDDEFMRQRLDSTNERLKRPDPLRQSLNHPSSSKKFKTVRFLQGRVHDFAWFADKRFYVSKGEVTLKRSGRTVNTWAYFTPMTVRHWRKAISYLNASTAFYSEHLGDYPYNHVSAVDGLIMAGGGMEYPNITVINAPSSGFDLDVVIAHEVGHNWLYGILGSNERDSPFMDEGLNSFYELRYVRSRYPGRTMNNYVQLDSSSKLMGFNRIPAWKEKDLLYSMTMRSNDEQPLTLTSTAYSDFNYGSMIYSKTAVVMDNLLSRYGAEKMDAAMQKYYSLYSFRHPTPDDLFNTLAAELGPEISDFRKMLFDGVGTSDYKLKHVKRNSDGTYSVRLKNKGLLPLPLDMVGVDGTNRDSTWYEGFRGRKTVQFTHPAKTLEIDPRGLMPEFSRTNNFSKTSGLFRKARPLRFKFATSMDDPRWTTVNYVPVAGANVYNGGMVGLAFYNYGFTTKKFEYMVAPMFAFGDHRLTGFTEFNYNFFPTQVFKTVTLGVRTKSFSYNTNTLYNNTAAFLKVQPYLTFEFKRPATSSIRQQLTFSSSWLLVDSLYGKFHKNTQSLINQVTYSFSNKYILHPQKLEMSVQQMQGTVKLWFSGKQEFRISKKNDFSIRVFAGTFLSGSKQSKSYYAFRSAGISGWQDYAFNGNYIGRNESSGVASNQFIDGDGAMKVYTSLGQTSTWLASVNFVSPKVFIPIRIFADVAFTDRNFIGGNTFLWDAGLNVTLVKDIVDVYLPLFYSSAINDELNFANKGFLERIRFTLNIHKFVPRQIIRDNLF